MGAPGVSKRKAVRARRLAHGSVGRHGSSARVQLLSRSWACRWVVRAVPGGACHCLNHRVFLRRCVRRAARGAPYAYKQYTGTLRAWDAVDSSLFQNKSLRGPTHVSEPFAQLYPELERSATRGVTYGSDAGLNFSSASARRACGSKSEKVRRKVKKTRFLHGLHGECMRALKFATFPDVTFRDLDEFERLGRPRERWRRERQM